MTIDARTSGASGNEIGKDPPRPCARPKSQAPRQHASDRTHESATHVTPPTGPTQTPHATRSLTSPPPRPPLRLSLAHIRKRHTTAKTRSTVTPPASDIRISSNAKLHTAPLAHEAKDPSERYAALVPRMKATAGLGMMRLPRSTTLHTSSAERIARSSSASCQPAARTPAHPPAIIPHAVTILRVQTGHPASSLLAAAQPATPPTQAPTTDATASRNTTLNTASMTAPINALHHTEMVCEHTYANWAQMSPRATSTLCARAHTPHLTCTDDRE